MSPQCIRNRDAERMWYVLFFFDLAAVPVAANGVDWPEVSVEGQYLVRTHGTNESGARP